MNFLLSFFSFLSFLYSFLKILLLSFLPLFLSSYFPSSFCLFSLPLSFLRISSFLSSFLPSACLLTFLSSFFSPSLAAIVDGLACAFLVGAQDALNYNLLYDCIIATLGVGAAPGAGGLKNTPDHALYKCAMHYHFIVTWRLLGSLPPSTKYLGKLGIGFLLDSVDSKTSVPSRLLTTHTISFPLLLQLH